VPDNPHSQNIFRCVFLQMDADYYGFFWDRQSHWSELLGSPRFGRRQEGSAWIVTLENMAE
jgi:hypothetical protein